MCDIPGGVGTSKPGEGMWHCPSRLFVYDSMFHYFYSFYRRRYHKRPFCVCSTSKSFENDAVPNIDKQNSKHIPDPGYHIESHFDAPVEESMKGSVRQSFTETFSEIWFLISWPISLRDGKLMPAFSSGVQFPSVPPDSLDYFI